MCLAAVQHLTHADALHQMMSLHMWTVVCKGQHLHASQGCTHAAGSINHMHSKHSGINSGNCHCRGSQMRGILHLLIGTQHP